MKKATNQNQPTGSPDNPPKITDTSTYAQRLRMLLRLRQGPATTNQLMHECNAMRVGSRIHELRAMGYQIHTHRISEQDYWGRKHNGIALYVLMSEVNAEAAA